MKNLLLFFLLFVTTTSYSQVYNLINNPSFENYKPNKFNNIDTNSTYNYIYFLNDTEANAENKCWFRATNWGELFIDTNALAYSRTGKSLALIIGQAYANIKISTKEVLYFPSQGDFRFYVQTKLLAPLQNGKKYFFTMYVGGIKTDTSFNYSGTNFFEITNLGVHFSNEKLAYFNRTNLLNIKPQINFTNFNFPKIDTFSYTKLEASYIAQGGEEYITIGNFDSAQNFTFGNLSKYSRLRDTISTFFQLYLDDVSLVADSLSPILNIENFSLGKDTFICDGEKMKIGGQSNFFHYWWNTGDTTQYITITQAGTYWCSVDVGCTTYSDTIVVFNSSLPTDFLKNEITICSQENTELLAPSNYQYLWSTGEQTQKINVNRNDYYWCTISNECGSYTDSIQVKIIPCDIYFPTAFSPNGDGLNDEFKPLGAKELINNYSIYNRWGEKVFSNDNAVYGWDGKYKSIDCSAGTYFYICKYKLNNEEKIIKGDVELVR